MFVTLMSFGYRFGPPEKMDAVFDVRKIPNPRGANSSNSGRSMEIAAVVLASSRAQKCIRSVINLVHLQSIKEKPPEVFSVAVGCLGGRHRSVAVISKLGEELRKSGVGVEVIHLDLVEGA